MTAARRLLIATTNAGKIKELGQMIGALSVEIVTPSDVGGVPDVIEDGATFEANARKKAQEIAVATGVMTLADDSGLEVDALQGAPGVRSARFSEPDPSPAKNNAKLLDALRGVPREQRTARFRCVLAVADATGAVVAIAHGACEGRIVEVTRGEGGFGYDPLFVPLGREETMAELTPAEKHAISHRGRAMDALLSESSVWLSRGTSSTMVP